MKKFVAIIAGEPNSISSEIIFKIWKKKKLYKSKLFFIIGSIHLLNMQKKKLNRMKMFQNNSFEFQNFFIKEIKHSI